MATSLHETRPRPAVGTPATWARFLLGFLILWAILAGASSGDPTARWGPAILAAVVAASLGVSLGLYRLSLREAVRALGLGRPDRRSLTVSAAVSALVLLVWPATVLLSGASIPLRSDWPVVLIGILCLHGLAEELVWRGYVFRRLAQGRSFWPAVWWSMPLIAVTHIPIVLTSGPAIGIGAMLVAAVTSIALSRLYVMGGGTLWAPALLHTAIDSFKLVVLPAAALTIYPFLIIGFSLVVPLLVLVVPPTRRSSGPRHTPPTGRKTMNQSDQTDVPTFAGKPAGRPKSLWRIPVIAATATAGLTVLSIVLDAGNERARDLALLIGAPTLYLLLPATAICFVVALILQIRRSRIGRRRQ